MHKQSIYASFELVFNTLYPFAVASTVLLMLLHRDRAVEGFITLLFSSILLPLVRSALCLLFMREAASSSSTRWDLFVMSFYGPLLPCKLYALITLTDSTWGHRQQERRQQQRHEGPSVCNCAVEQCHCRPPRVPDDYMRLTQ